MDFIGEETSRGVRERRFDVSCEGRTVPGLLWTPEAATDVPGIVLLGHGGSLHKRADYVLAIARRSVRSHGLAAVAIDGPSHGDRRSDGGTDPAAVGRDFDDAWKADTTGEIVADWRATLDAVEGELGAVPVGYFGLSMGTMMGVPLVAAEPRIRVAVLGLMGTWGPNGTRLREDAPHVSCPVRFLVQWDDEIVPRERALELFDLLGSKEKSLRAHPGIHVQVPADEMRDVPRFLAGHLAS